MLSACHWSRSIAAETVALIASGVTVPAVVALIVHPLQLSAGNLIEYAPSLATVSVPALVAEHRLPGVGILSVKE